MGDYLIPANTKRSQLIFNVFRPLDLGILITGGVLTLILLFAVISNTVFSIIIKLFPVAVASFLVMPVPHYHNVLVFLRDLYYYLTRPSKYLWRGWCSSYVTNDSNSKQQ